MDRYKNRELVLLLLYAAGQGQSLNEACIAMVMDECKVAKRYVVEAATYAESIWSRVEKIDPIIEKTVMQYSLERLYSIERSVLRWAVFEIAMAQLPLPIIIAEAKRLTKKFSTDDGAQFVHAVIAAIAQIEGLSV